MKESRKNRGNGVIWAIILVVIVAIVVTFIVIAKSRKYEPGKTENGVYLNKWADVQKANLLVGVYPGKSLEAGEGYFLKAAGNFIYRATVAVSLPPFSCYLPSDEKRTYLKLEETTDGISECPEYHDYSEYSEYADAIYDLSGRKVENRKSSNPQLPKGIYIFGGRKIIVK